ncbi:MAG: riboflavin synthase [Roseiarcus sp.]
MFTGLISDVGEVLAARDEGRLRRLRVSCGYDAGTIEVGASLAHSGVCLTVVGVDRTANRAQIEVDLGAETLAVTTAGRWRVGTRLNLERPLRLGDELGGHMVSGHVDGVAPIIAREDFYGMARFDLRAPAGLAMFIAQKGSVALDGTSLTVNRVEGDVFSVLLIPHTLAVTTWGERRVGDLVNLEVDQMARYAARLIEARAAA